MNSKEELISVIELIKDKTGMLQSEISKKAGYSEKYLSEALSKGTVSQKTLSNLKRTFGLENATDTPESYIVKRRGLKNTQQRKAVPFFDAPATAGITETEMTPIHAPAGTIDVGDLLHDSQAAIRIYGNSMNPNYPPGCVVGLVQCSSEYIEPGEVYVIETRDRRIVKRLFYKDDDAESTHFMCYSDNTMKFSGGARDGKLAYPPYYLPKSEIVRMFQVTGVIKRNANSIIINRNTDINSKRK